jgi:hypothetical protein
VTRDEDALDTDDNKVVVLPPFSDPLRWAPQKDLVAPLGRILPLPLVACIRVIDGDPAPNCARRRRSRRADGPEAA